MVTRFPRKTPVSMLEMCMPPRTTLVLGITFLLTCGRRDGGPGLHEMNPCRSRLRPLPLVSMLKPLATDLPRPSASPRLASILSTSPIQNHVPVSKCRTRGSLRILMICCQKHRAPASCSTLRCAAYEIQIPASAHCCRTLRAATYFPIAIFAEGCEDHFRPKLELAQPQHHHPVTTIRWQAPSAV